jgi:hypothetical protein
MYPSSTTLLNLNQKNLNSDILWTSYFGQGFLQLPFVPSLNATSDFDFNNASSLSSLTPYSRGATLPQNPVDTSKVSEPFVRFGDSILMDYFDLQSARGVDQLLQQIRSIKVRILRELSNQFFNEVVPNPHLDGLPDRASTVITLGTPLNLAVLYETRYSVTPSNAEGLGWGGNAWFSHSKAFRSLQHLLSSSVAELTWKRDEKSGIQIPYFLGSPWFVDDTINVTTNFTRIYFANLDHLQILYSANSNYPSDSKGLQVLAIPTQQSISEQGFFVTGIYAIQNDIGSVAMIRNVDVTGF